MIDARGLESADGAEGRRIVAGARGCRKVRWHRMEPHSGGIGMRLYLFVLTRFLYANRYPLRSKTLLPHGWQAQNKKAAPVRRGD